MRAVTTVEVAEMDLAFQYISAQSLDLIEVIAITFELHAFTVPPEHQI